MDYFIISLNFIDFRIIFSFLNLKAYLFWLFFIILLQLLLFVDESTDSLRSSIINLAWLGFFLAIGYWSYKNIIIYLIYLDLISLFNTNHDLVFRYIPFSGGSIFYSVDGSNSNYLAWDFAQVVYAEADVCKFSWFNKGDSFICSKNFYFYQNLIFIPNSVGVCELHGSNGAILQFWPAYLGFDVPGSQVI